VKPVRVILSPEAEEVYNYLNREAATSKVEKSILNAIEKKKELIKANPHYGEPVGRNIIPREYVEKYGITNLFRVELPMFWRMLYTLTNDGSEVEIIVFVLDIMDHKKYDKTFGYKKH